MNSAPNHEIVIIRRGGHAQEEGHHGGVWKIAFADFMTAMMAFFLVLWIVNSSSKETRASIARYFNPVKLSDTTPARKGLQTAKELDFDAAGGEAGKADKGDDCAGATTPAEPQSHDPPKIRGAPKGKARVGCNTAAPRAASGRFAEDALLQSPQAVLTSIVAAATAETAVESQSDAERSEADSKASEASPLSTIERDAALQGLTSDHAFVDPFEPMSPVLSAKPAGEGRPALRAPVARATPLPSPPPAPPVEVAPKEPGSSLGETLSAPLEANAAARASLADDLGEALKDERLRRGGPAIEIKAVPEGTLISLTDGLDFGMFAIGSAEPQPRAIAVMAQIAGVLKRHPGALVIRGHTDGRQYPSARYDNWHLSADRAQMSYQMLLRGGLEAQRLDRIEGHADRSLKNAADAGAPENRRIEILLKADKP